MNCQKHAGIHTYFATFSEPHYCPLFALLEADLPYDLSGGRSLPPGSCSPPWDCLPIYHSTLSAGQLCWEILASSFLPTTSEPKHKDTYKAQSLPALALGSTGRGDSPCPVPHNRTMLDTASVVLSCEQHHASKCLKTSNLVQLKTKSRNIKHVSFQAPSAATRRWTKGCPRYKQIWLPLA